MAMLPTSCLPTGALNVTTLLVDIACLERNLEVNLYCLLDLSIHYYASCQDVYRSLAAFGISDTETADAIYDYIRTEPTTYLKYYLGYLEILALQEEQKSFGGRITPRFGSIPSSCRQARRTLPIWKNGWENPGYQNYHCLYENG